MGRILSRPAVTLMMSDQLTPEIRASSPGLSIFLGRQSWGFGGAVVIRRDDIAATPGRYGWEGGPGTSWQIDPAEGLAAIPLTQASFAGPGAPTILNDFWTTAYQALDD